jgi:hypothetical protein
VAWPRWRKIAPLSYVAVCLNCFSRSALIVALARGSNVPPPTVVAGMFNLEAMWEAAGRPAGKHPIDFIQSRQGRQLIRDGLARGLQPNEIIITENPAIQDVIDTIVAEWRAK